MFGRVAQRSCVLRGGGVHDGLVASSKVAWQAHARQAKYIRLAPPTHVCGLASGFHCAQKLLDAPFGRISLLLQTFELLGNILLALQCATMFACN